jgi:hypothetical protein
MKANEAPEKIYLSAIDLEEVGHLLTELNDRDDVEYVRTDAFIEKACEWIREFNNHHYIMRYSDSCEPPLSEVTEWFKNYMKGG